MTKRTSKKRTSRKRAGRRPRRNTALAHAHGGDKRLQQIVAVTQAIGLAGAHGWTPKTMCYAVGAIEGAPSITPQRANEIMETLADMGGFTADATGGVMLTRTGAKTYVGVPGRQGQWKKIVTRRRRSR